MRPDHRGCAACRARSGEGRSQCCHAPRPCHLAPRAGASLRVDGGRAARRLPGASRTRCLCARAPPGREPPCAVALAGGRLLHDAGDDVCVARLRGPPRRPVAGDGDAAALGLLGHLAARGAVLLRPLLLQRAARHTPAPCEHGPARGPGHADHLRDQFAGHLRSFGPLRRGSLLRLADHVRLLPAVRPLAGAAPARPHGRRAGSGDEPPARCRAARERSRPFRARGHAPPAGGRPGARAQWRGLPGRRHHRARPHPCRRGPAHRRVHARAACRGRYRHGRQLQPGCRGRCAR